LPPFFKPSNSLKGSKPREYSRFHLKRQENLWEIQGSRLTLKQVAGLKMSQVPNAVVVGRFDCKKIVSPHSEKEKMLSKKS
jgi:hypothetical protein